VYSDYLAGGAQAVRTAADLDLVSDLKRLPSSTSGIQRTVRYTELAADRFKSFWENEA